MVRAARSKTRKPSWPSPSSMRRNFSLTSMRTGYSPSGVLSVKVRNTVVGAGAVQAANMGNSRHNNQVRFIRNNRFVARSGAQA
jgi:hypothetical protein